MKTLPESVRTAWANREGPVVLATFDTAGIPNAIYASNVREFGDDTIVIADNYFNKTRANILAGSRKFHGVRLWGLGFTGVVSLGRVRDGATTRPLPSTPNPKPQSLTPSAPVRSL